jgi:hypothetical protein
MGARARAIIEENGRAPGLELPSGAPVISIYLPVRVLLFSRYGALAAREGVFATI